MRWMKWPSSLVAHAQAQPWDWYAVCGVFVPSAAVESLPHDGRCARCTEVLRDGEDS